MKNNKINRIIKRIFNYFQKNNKRKIIGFVVFLLFLFWFVAPMFIFLKTGSIPNSNIVFDTNGIEIGEIIPENNYRHQNFEYDQIPEFLKKIVVSLEDKRFWNHNGIDYKALVRAMINNIQAGSFIEGGSTIDSQLIRNSYRLNKPRGILRKFLEFYGARILNYHKSKKEILTDYVNILYFGYLNYGFQSASKYFFDKPIGNLTKAEMIALMVLPKNPNKYDPYKKEKNFKVRFDLLLNYYLQNGVISQEEYDQIKHEKIIFNKKHENKLPYVVDFLQNGKIEKYNQSKSCEGKDEKGRSIVIDKPSNINYQLKTTIDYDLTRKVDELAKSTIYELLWKNVGDYGVLVVDRKTMELKVMLGGIDYKGLGGQVNSTLALNQAGSAVKPFTYLLAFKDFGMKPDDVILDLPVQFQTEKGYAYTPKNYSLDYKGEVSLAEALSQSLNIPATKLADQIGVEKLLQFYRQVGLKSLDKNSDYYGLALTLGVGEVSLYELTRAFGVFANGGELCDIIYLKGQEKNCSQIVEKKYTDMIEMILTNRYFRLNGFPIGSNLDFSDRFVFLKSGTSRNFADNWTIGYTDNYIIGVWVGNKDGSPMKGVSGASGAGDIFNKLVYLLEDEYKEVKPNNLQKEESDFVEILSPLGGSVYLIDDSIPTSRQNIKFEFTTNIEYNDYSWFINGKNFTGKFWNLEKGTFYIELNLENNGQVVGKDSINIQVDK